MDSRTEQETISQTPPISRRQAYRAWFDKERTSDDITRQLAKQNKRLLLDELTELSKAQEAATMTKAPAAHKPAKKLNGKEHTNPKAAHRHAKRKDAIKGYEASPIDEYLQELLASYGQEHQKLLLTLAKFVMHNQDASPWRFEALHQETYQKLANHHGSIKEQYKKIMRAFNNLHEGHWERREEILGYCFQEEEQHSTNERYYPRPCPQRATKKNLEATPQSLDELLQEAKGIVKEQGYLTAGTLGSARYQKLMAHLNGMRGIREAISRLFEEEEEPALAEQAYHKRPHKQQSI